MRIARTMYRICFRTSSFRVKPRHNAIDEGFVVLVVLISRAADEEFLGYPLQRWVCSATPEPQCQAGKR